MTRIEYRDEMDKLSHRFDKKYYPNEVLDLIFVMVENLSFVWLKKTVSYFMGQHRPALIPEFREQAKIEHDRIQIGTVARSNDRSFPDSMFTECQKKFLFEVTRRVCSGEIKLKNDFLLHFTSQLTRIVALKDKESAHELFIESAKWCEISYKPEVRSEV